MIIVYRYYTAAKGDNNLNPINEFENSLQATPNVMQSTTGRSRIMPSITPITGQFALINGMNLDIIGNDITAFILRDTRVSDTKNSIL
jgi:hypothetical protein